MKRLLAFLFAFFLHSSLHHESVKAMNEFEVRHFRDVIDRSLQQAKIFLDHEKSQELVVVDGTVPHRYEDKYLLAEQVTKGAAVGVLNSLQAIGMSAQMLTTLQSWSINSTVVLRMEWEESSVFKKTVTHREEATTVLEAVLALGDLVTGRATTKVITTITDYHYDYTVRHHLMAMRGVGAHAEDVLELSSAQGSQEKVYSMQSPSLAFSTSTKEDVDISWLLRMLSTTEKDYELSFRIQRERASCRTPVRNEEVQAMLSHGRRLTAWNQKLTAMLMLSFHRGEPALDRGRLLSAHEKVLFVPVTTFFQQTPATAHNHSQPATTAGPSAWSSASSSAGVLEAGYLDAFSAEQRRSLAAVLADTLAAFPSASTTTATHIRMLVIIQHMSAVLQVYEQSVSYLEGMLRAQLTAAIGREVQDADMEAYMSYHYSKLYNDDSRPRAFRHAVRRTEEQSPEGSIRIEVQSSASGGYAPIGQLRPGPTAAPPKA